MNEYNNLDLLKERQLSIVPIHFTKTSLGNMDPFFNVDKILFWIRTKLKGRFSLVKTPMISTNDRVKSEFIVAFEDPKEMTFFILGCPYIRRN